MYVTVQDSGKKQLNKHKLESRQNVFNIKYLIYFGIFKGEESTLKLRLKVIVTKRYLSRFQWTWLRCISVLSRPEIILVLYFDYIYIYAFSRRFYPKRLTLHSSYSFTFYQLLLSLGIEPMILALLAPCSTIWATGKQLCCLYGKVLIGRVGLLVCTRVRVLYFQ